MSKNFENSQHVISFSGGKDSTALLFLMLEKGCKINRIINVDTTKEFPEMYEHIRKVQSMIDIPIEHAKVPFDYWFAQHVKTRGKNVGKQGYGWPSPLGRWGTALKRTAVNHLLNPRPARRPLIARLSASDAKDDQSTVNPSQSPERANSERFQGSPIIYTGIAADEAHRAQKNGGKHATPLIDWGITEKEALSYCKSLGFDWGGGLYDEGRSRVSCYCCPLQRIGELRLTYLHHPDLWENMRRMDALTPYPFRRDYTLEQLEEKFKNEKSIHNRTTA